MTQPTSGLGAAKEFFETVSAAANAVTDVIKAYNAVDSSRSVVIEIDNNTDFVFTRYETRHYHGGFGPRPPHETIPPRSAELFGSKDTGFATGTEGRVNYAGPDVQFMVKWNNPWVGSNSSRAELGGTFASAFRMTSLTGSGNTNAHMRFAIFDKFERQDQWRWCHKCQSLFFGGAPAAGSAMGTCPAGGAHTAEGSGNYVLTMAGTGAPGQSDWHWCPRCQGLVFGTSATGRCPAGGAHTPDGGGYVLIDGIAGALGQSDWNWCHRCAGLFYGGTPAIGATAGRCPAGGGHSSAGSGNYILPSPTK